MADRELKNQTVEFIVDTPALLVEISQHAIDRNTGVLKVPLNVFREYLVRVADRAAELDDPKLNILMLSMNLYESPAEGRQALINEQRTRISPCQIKK